ncbi:MAG: PEP/pyruvate-binding domain-containing protein [Dehalococcoidales bacterium]|nr:PEP/pyruvate-binding domain-containing protein [Dehalococcoidales bacterium]
MKAQEVLIESFRSGLPQLDSLLQGLLPGDNVVLQVDHLGDYPYFAGAFIEQSIKDGHKCVYLSFAAHSPILKPVKGLEIIRIDPSPGFDYFSAEVHRIIKEHGRKCCYVFDSLSDLVDEWATDELLANFFQVTCPYLYQVDAIAYFALRRGQHGNSAISRIRETTQVLIDIFCVEKNTYVQPLKVSGRYSRQMFLPHLITADSWVPVARSGDAARLLSSVVKQPLSIRNESIAPWDSVYRKLLEHYETGGIFEGDRISDLKEALSRMLIGNHKKLVELSNRYLTLENLLQIRQRVIGSGRIGGKSAGMLLARGVLNSTKGNFEYSNILEEHDSFYIGSDVFFTFLVNNDLFLDRLELNKKGSLSWDEFNKLEQRFLEGNFKDEILEQFRDMIDYYGQAPIIVRSSSLLEDGFTDAFAGKYRSEFCANQGSPESRLNELLTAIKLVYASALNPDALAYRKKRGFSEGDEQMAILVQRVSGVPYRQYFFPALAGVAFSRNLFAWTDRIDSQKGMIRLVFGMGTRAVNRVSGDYPRMIAVSHPALRPETATEVSKYSQRMVDAIDISANDFKTISFNKNGADFDFPSIDLFVSDVSDDFVKDWLVKPAKDTSNNLVLTFNNLINQTDIVEIMGDILNRLERAWEQPVDIEFTAYIDSDKNVKINLLQCRSLHVPSLGGVCVSIPKIMPKEQVLFRSDRAINAGMVDNIGYIVYIDPKIYAEIPDIETKKSIGRVIGKLNKILTCRDNKVMLMGPGRWGSTNIELGINVGYADIDNTAVLVEVAREKAGQRPEVSYGTHFFQDLIESNILYLPVYPDDEKSDFNFNFFSDSENVFLKLLPDMAKFEKYIKVIEVPLSANAALAKVIADPQNRNAICVFDRSGLSNINK